MSKTADAPLPRRTLLALAILILALAFVTGLRGSGVAAALGWYGDGACDDAEAQNPGDPAGCRYDAGEMDCGNGIDDDSDERTDSADPDCGAAPTSEPEGCESGWWEFWAGDCGAPEPEPAGPADANDVSDANVDAFVDTWSCACPQSNSCSCGETYGCGIDGAEPCGDPYNCACETSFSCSCAGGGETSPAGGDWSAAGGPTSLAGVCQNPDACNYGEMADCDLSEACMWKKKGSDVCGDGKVTGDEECDGEASNGTCENCKLDCHAGYGKRERFFGAGMVCSGWVINADNPCGETRGTCSADHPIDMSYVPEPGSDTWKCGGTICYPSPFEQSI